MGAAVLKAGGSVDVPKYDFTVHSRTKETTRSRNEACSELECAGWKLKNIDHWC